MRIAWALIRFPIQQSKYSAKKDQVQFFTPEDTFSTMLDFTKVSTYARA